MKYISISDRFRPFIHTPGMFCPIPATCLAAKVFPAFVQIFNIAEYPYKLINEHRLPIAGRVDPFTLLLDVEKGGVTVFGEGSSGYFRYQILPATSVPGYELVGNKGALLSESANTSPFPQIRERLALGCNKKLDWDLVKRRLDLKEILPVWHRLGLLVPDQSKKTLSHLFPKKKQEIEESLLSLFLGYFQGILTPRNEDLEYQGLTLPLLPQDTSPLALLKEGSDWIRTLFVEEVNEIIHILPHLPSIFHEGRLIHVPLSQGELNIEWSKKTIRRVIFIANSSGSVIFKFPNMVRTCRVRKNLQEKGKILTCDVHMDVEEGVNYLLDRFQ